MDRISNRRTGWNLINIKARSEQNTSHYVRSFRKLSQDDPMVRLPRGKSGSLKSMQFSEFLDNENEPKWIRSVLLSYTIVDPARFYNRREQENVNIDNWDSDIVANKKEAELFFIPSVHTLALKRNSEINLANIVLYLSEALNKIESEAFDVNVIVEHDFIDRVLNAHAIFRIKANISYSNPGHSGGFSEVFEGKIKNMQPDDFTILAKGSQTNPLIKEEDGLLRSIINISERDGSLTATIQATEGSKIEKIDSKDHPRVLFIPQIINDVSSTIYNTIKTLFNN